jgi:hypothetical protein
MSGARFAIDEVVRHNKATIKAPMLAKLLTPINLDDEQTEICQQEISC